MRQKRKKEIVVKRVIALILVLLLCFQIGDFAVLANQYQELGVEYEEQEIMATSWFEATPMVAAGSGHSIALRRDGTVWQWGDQWRRGNDGMFFTWPQTRPLQVSYLNRITAISAGGNHSLALCRNGRVWAWGDNSSGQLGDGTTVFRYPPVQVLNLYNIISISAGASRSLALRSDGTVWTWGAQLRRDESGRYVYGPQTTPVQISNLSNIIAISSGNAHSFALRNDGTVWAWGRNEHGELGDGTTVHRITPIQVPNLNNITAISVGAGFSVAQHNDGSMWAWGNNFNGRLGNGTNTNSLIPVRVSDLEDILSISAGHGHTLALCTV